MLPCKGRSSWSPSLYWGQAVLQKKISLSFFRVSGSKADHFLRIQPKGVSGGRRPEVWLPIWKERIHNTEVRGVSES